MNGRSIGGSLFNHVPFFSGEVSLDEVDADRKEKRGAGVTRARLNPGEAPATLRGARTLLARPVAALEDSLAHRLLSIIPPGWRRISPAINNTQVTQRA